MPHYLVSLTARADPRLVVMQVAEFPAGGFMFRDNVHVEAFEDPKVSSEPQASLLNSCCIYVHSPMP